MSKFLITSLVAWTSLGFYRGTETYKADFLESLFEYEKKIKEKQKSLSFFQKKVDELRKKAEVFDDKMTETVNNTEGAFHTTGEELRKSLDKIPDTWDKTTLSFNISYEEKHGLLKDCKKPIFMYSDMAGKGVVTALAYSVVPVTCFITIPFEIRRCELWARGIKKEDYLGKNERHSKVRKYYIDF